MSEAVMWIDFMENFYCVSHFLPEMYYFGSKLVLCEIYYFFRLFFSNFLMKK